MQMEQKYKFQCDLPLFFACSKSLSETRSCMSPVESKMGKTRLSNMYSFPGAAVLV